MNIDHQYETLELERDGEWLTVWFNRPEKRNPLSTTMTAELTGLFVALRDETDIRGVTLRGRGGFFCAGADLAGFHAMAQAPRDEVICLSESVAELFGALRAVPQVTVALVEGAAMAGGLGLACCCDVAIGLNDARFGFSETQIGITPAQIARYVLMKAGYATGRRLMVTASRFKGDAALEYGILDRVGDNTEALEEIERAIRADTMRCAPGAVAATKRLLDQIPETASEDIPRLAAENFTDCFLGEEGREGIASFNEKRKPVWFREV